MHNPKAPKETASIFLFLPVVGIALYFVYLTVTIPFKAGLESGAKDALLNPPPPPEVATEEKVFDHRKLIQPSPDLIALGSKLYAANCASCHGAEGLGNGTAGSKLAVKPRNFHLASSDWKNGASVLDMYATLEKGLGSMPAFPALDPEQRYAVIHYIHDAFMKEVGWPKDGDAAIAALPAPGGAVKITIDPYKETRVPVDFAIDRLIQETKTASEL
jgi:mono/diheme cytochrome c family protein